MKNKLLIVSLALGSLFAFSTFTFAQQQKCTEEGSILRVTKARSGNFETVTFEVKSKAPGYKVTNVKPPFTDYSGDHQLHIAGKYFKSIVFQGINWTCEIAENFSARTTNVAGVKNTEQFEGVVNYVIGYRKKSKYVGTTKSTTGGKTKVIIKFKR